MDRDEFRALQSPLKQRYREDPQSALVTLRAEGSLGQGIACSVATGKTLGGAGYDYRNESRSKSSTSLNRGIATA
jgi:hypothetical protein